ncbi:hypothetical protein LC55x_3169 [Lysobacter capsici]|jgi:hypothetical protein|uniref:Uncharacterized protein n=1 Tax=Lysobacter capsici AZ78 TaxID=1444315 RepID=A0A108U4L8_9GAMM|nr:hypothetical protein [Lysobacter capsici]ALN86432.1 hypothetical protein LC55x_3169 [Lysobacter capsici]KWS02464.1 hypothetical protein AZ78_0008 [Lysobacter capsici AZ78]
MIVAILTLPVLLYQLLFVAIMYIASRFGHKPMLVALVACLAWTVTHLFFPPLAIVQSAVIVGSYFFFRRKLLSAQPARPALIAKADDENPVE